MRVSKTNYLIWRECRHNAWLKGHAPEVYRAKPLSAFDQSIIKTGNEIDSLARSLFPGGVEIGREDFVGTRRHIANRTPILYQPVFATDTLITACDILVWSGSAYDLYEVKASTSGDDKSAKDDLYTHDLGFQTHVLKSLDVPLGRTMLVRLNTDYIRHGTIDLDALFTKEDFTVRVNALLPTITQQVVTAHADLARTQPLPAPCGCVLKGRSSHCTTFAHSNPTVPAYSVHDLARIGASKKKLASLVEQNILVVTDVPDDMDLSLIQMNQVTVAKSQQPVIDRAAIAEFLDGIQGPIAFLDYETFPAALPRFDGYGPFDQIPFQFSLDVLNNGQLTHHEFLFTETSSPDAAFIAALDLYLPDAGSIVAWNKTFETGINKKLALRKPGTQSMMDAINARVVDLEDVFKKQMLVHPGFKGKTSIKFVLPTLVPSLTYKNLAIQEGATASDTWNKIVSGEFNAATADQKRGDLLTYCALDTRAMVEIWHALRMITSDARHVAA
jgi:hypothetical protein